MSDELVRRWKLHWVWEDDKEERWLEAQARQGLHLVHATPLCFYTFRRGAAQEMAYRLDYNRQARRDPSYRRLFEDAGWEHAESCMGWEYWRKPVQAGAQAEIFSDNASKLEKYKRVLGLVVLVNVPNLVNLSVLPATWHTPTSESFTGGFAYGLMTGLALLSLYGASRILLRMRQLRSGMPA
ncbi:MAG TPA: DUF2812 domain-containing protein [Telluria sp.]|nr:DUF2812 domain-containing protein [Telluria sp.]